MPEKTQVMLGAELPGVSGRPLAPAAAQRGRPWRVLLVDDSAAVRTELKVLLEEHTDLQVVGEASDGEEAMALAERYRPDVTMMDIGLPRVSGIEATRHIMKILPQSLVIGISSL
ncbi:MAG: response regulator, partial [Nitrospirota bacterium]